VRGREGGEVQGDFATILRGKGKIFDETCSFARATHSFLGFINVFNFKV
jgi:hypothetical protein